MPPILCANPPSAANLFVQLCARRTASSYAATPISSTILDVLLPRTQARASHIRASRYKPPRVNTVPIASRNVNAANTANARRHAVAGKRAFTTSRPLAKTLAIHNPQTDEDGNEMLLEITPRAANRLSQIMSKDKNPYLALRIQVESGGCHGFQYIMSLTTLPSTPGSPPALNEDDTIFAFAADTDATDAEGSPSSSSPSLTSPKIVLDLPSLELLKGSKVDYTMELIGSQFKIVDNPLATSSCGCGTSFDIKM